MATKKTKKQGKIDGERVARLYGRGFSNVQVPIMSVPRIYDAGMTALDAGGTDQDIVEAMRPVVDQVKVA